MKYVLRNIMKEIKPVPAKSLVNGRYKFREKYKLVKHRTIKIKHFYQIKITIIRI